MPVTERDRYLHKLATSNVAVLGLGVSNIPVVRFLRSLGAQVTACDRLSRPQLGTRVAEFEQLGVSFQLGEDYLKGLENFDVIVRTPGMRPDLPAINRALDAGATLTSEIEMVFDLCPCPIMGITGSDGKTTTTSLIAAIFEKDRLGVHIGGNIGRPLIEKVMDFTPQDTVVLELSSFQLMTMKKSPSYALLTNISPNHLDMHTSYAEYISAKENIFRYQKNTDTLVLNWDNEETRIRGQEAKGRVWYYSLRHQLQQGAVIDGDFIYILDGNVRIPICPVHDIKLPGTHNIENVMAAALLCHLAGVRAETIRDAVKNFRGVEHRLELVTVDKNVTYCNDSSASSPTRAIAALNAFHQPLILIAGGSEKHISFDGFAREVINKVKVLILLGATGPKIKAAVEGALQEHSDQGLQIIEVKDLYEAVQRAKDVAMPGDVVLLAPACASFDMFNNFPERGRLFKDYVMQVTGKGS